jgi:hypothetical protein
VLLQSPSFGESQLGTASIFVPRKKVSSFYIMEVFDHWKKDIQHQDLVEYGLMLL